MPDQPASVELSEAALQHATRAAGRDPMRETGGLLLGWRTSDGVVHVTDMVEVPDPSARHTAYKRRHARATAALDGVLAAQPQGSPVGYVGEWHTHPAPVGPSWIDRREIRRISKKTSAPVALIVCAYDAKANNWTPVALCALAGRSSPAELRRIP